MPSSLADIFRGADGVDLSPLTPKKILSDVISSLYLYLTEVGMTYPENGYAIDTILFFEATFFDINSFWENIKNHSSLQEDANLSDAIDKIAEKMQGHCYDVSQNNSSFDFDWGYWQGQVQRVHSAMTHVVDGYSPRQAVYLAFQKNFLDQVIQSHPRNDG